MGGFTAHSYLADPTAALHLVGASHGYGWFLLPLDSAVASLEESDYPAAAANSSGQSGGERLSSATFFLARISVHA